MRPARQTLVLAVDAEAQVHPKGSPMYEHGNRLMDQKYGLLKKMFGFMGRKDDDQRVIIEIKSLSHLFSHSGRVYTDPGLEVVCSGSVIFPGFREFRSRCCVIMTRSVCCIRRG